MRLDGPSYRRVDIKRMTVGRAVATPFASWMGVARCTKASPEVRALWEGLLVTEAHASGGVLRCAPSTILDVGPGAISRPEAGTAQVALLDPAPSSPDAPVIAVPRFTYGWMPRKLRNFGHWLLDSCALGFSWTLDCERVLAGGVSR